MTFLPVIMLALLGLRAETGGQAANPPPPRYPHQSSASSEIDHSALATSPVKAALRAGNYPWYDPDADRVRPIWHARGSWLRWFFDRVEKVFKAIDRFLRRLKLGGGPRSGLTGNSIGTVMLLTFMAAFLIVLWVLWAREKVMAADRNAAGARLGAIARLAQLPEGIRPGSDDPWAEALRRRAAGDLAGAIVCLFAHQLLSLDQLGVIRLGPGRTGRQYVQGLRDRELRDSMGGTLLLFEEVYYGRRTPELKSFEAVWSRAQAFEERRSLLGASR